MGTYQRNIRFYPWYAVAANAFFWMPVFFLYFNTQVSLRDVLWLEAIYYITVVVLEVPSGYASDRFGRRPTLLLSCASLVFAYGIFAFSASFWPFAIAQMLLATGLALNSGTDTSFHLDSLTSCGREHEYGEREARISRTALWSTAAAALIGGAVSLWKLEAAYILSMVAALVGLGVVSMFKEPTATRPPELRFATQLKACATVARSSPLNWFLAFSVAATVVNHIPYEFYQPYIDALVARSGQHPFAESTPLVTGMHVGITFVIAGLLGGASITWANRIGTRRLLLLSMVGQTLLIGLMSLWLHPFIALLVVFRSSPGALQRAPINQAIAPRLPSHMRATYLSLQSLMGRLGFAATLVGLSWITTESANNAVQIETLLRVSALGALVIVAVLWIWNKVSPSPRT